MLNNQHEIRERIVFIKAQMTMLDALTVAIDREREAEWFDKWDKKLRMKDLTLEWLEWDKELQQLYTMLE